ncbi:MAG: hypothetical protein DRN24_07015, partial [Thermoplasmata archaeon]
MRYSSLLRKLRKNLSLGILMLFITTAFMPSASIVNADSHSEGFANVSNVDMNGQGDDVTVSPGASITISLDYIIWNREGCPGCIRQI